MRFKAVGRDVWDLAWGDPATGHWTSGLKRDMVVTRYPSEQAAIEAAESLNEHWNVPAETRLARFRAAAAAAIAEQDEQDEADVTARRLIDSLDFDIDL